LKWPSTIAQKLSHGCQLATGNWQQANVPKIRRACEYGTTRYSKRSWIGNGEWWMV